MLLYKRQIINNNKFCNQQGRNGKGSIFIFPAGNGGEKGDSCAFDGYTNSIYTIGISSVEMFNKKPAYTERCSAIMAVTYSGSKNHDGNDVSLLLTTFYEILITS